MTDLLKPVRRKTNTIVKGRALVIELRPGATDTIHVREAGRRSGYTVPIEAVYKLGARLEADRKRDEKKARKKARKGTRHA